MEKKHRPRISKTESLMKYGIPFSETEMDLVIVALGEFRRAHTHPVNPVRLSPKGLVILDSLIDNLKIAYTFFKPSK